MSSKQYIPKKFECFTTEKGKQILEAEGVQFVGMFLERFFEIMLPSNLRIYTFGPRMKLLVDSNERTRAYILSSTSPKEDSSIMLNQRFCVTFDVVADAGKEYVVGMVFDGNKTVFQSDRISFPALPPVRKEAAEKAIALALEWVNTFYPEWKNPAAYW